ncbi:NUDIX domain-containing protein [Methylocaldum sp.]|uniref:NUDIX domain-containing protein n=1 Tax=Methylocaldum sp. TaxID=1969727 RepID=UPI00322034F8
MMKTYILSAGVVIVRIYPAEPRYLLLRAFQYWDFPKGVVEEGEDPLAAAQREVFEETALTELNFRWGKGFWKHRLTVPARSLDTIWPNLPAERCIYPSIRCWASRSTTNFDG